MNALEILRKYPAFTISANGAPGWNVDEKKQMIFVGPQETMALAQVGITLPMRAEVAAAAIAKQTQAMTPAPQAQPPVPAASTGRRWFWFGGGLLAGIVLTVMVVRSRPSA